MFKPISISLSPNTEKDDVWLAFKLLFQPWYWKLTENTIGDWYTSPVAPADTQLDKIGYELGSCPKAEKLAKETLNLPTHINIKKEDAQKIVNFLEQFK